MLLNFQEKMLVPWQAVAPRIGLPPAPAGLQVCVTSRRDSILVFHPATHDDQLKAAAPADPIDVPENLEFLGLLDQVDSPDFDVEALKPFTNAQPLLCLVIYYCNSYGLIETLELDAAVLQRYVIDVETLYRPLPYHSGLHGADVLANAMRLLKGSRHPVYLTPIELLATIIACSGTLLAASW